VVRLVIVDMPAIGPATIQNAAAARLRGAAVAAGRVLIVERERCAREADAAGLFVTGYSG
jgi:UDP-2,3-diacylglucosamine hydrolase